MNAKIETAEYVASFEATPIADIRHVLNGIFAKIDASENLRREDINIHLRNGETISVIAEEEIGSKAFVYCVSTMWKGKLWPFLTLRRSC